MNNLEINASLKFSPYPGVEASANINKIPPKWVIAIGLLIVVYGIYQYCQKNQEKES